MPNATGDDCNGSRCDKLLVSVVEIFPRHQSAFKCLRLPVGANSLRRALQFEKLVSFYLEVNDVLIIKVPVDSTGTLDRPGIQPKISFRDIQLMSEILQPAGCRRAQSVDAM